MKVQVHNKLVRDGIPEYLKEKEIDAQVEIVEDEVRFLRLLLDKLEEEAQEVALTFEDEKLLEELGDVESVIDGILKAKGWTRAQLKKQQDKKDEENGRFENKVFLVKTIERE
jgi:predicted house-cleaning noncanonical NTP pyrophosphatase (MazG superfamily)